MKFILLFWVWHYASGTQTGSHNFLIHHGTSVDREVVQRIIDQLENDYREFRYFFNLSVSGRTKVYIHDDLFSLQSATLAHHFETGTVYKNEIHIAPVQAIEKNIALSSLLTQQTVRLVLYSRLLNGCPRWLYEGAAAFFAGMHVLQSPPEYTSVVRPSDLNELLVTTRNENEFFDTIYITALSFETILHRYGEAHTITLFRLFNGEFGYEEAVPYSLGVTVEEFERQWLIDLKELLATYRESHGQ
jgi:hypothetical protein